MMIPGVLFFQIGFDSGDGSHYLDVSQSSDVLSLVNSTSQIYRIDGMEIEKGKIGKTDN